MSDEKRRVILRKCGRVRPPEPEAPTSAPPRPSGEDAAPQDKSPADGGPRLRRRVQDVGERGSDASVRRRRPAGGKAAAPPSKPSKPSKPKREETPARVVERTPEQEAAHELSKNESIPVVHAHRVLRGEASLEEVKEALNRKEEATRLAREEGLAPSLAGQVAAGHLKLERARVLQRLRSVRTEPIDWDAFKIALEAKQAIALATFADGWRVGQVVETDVYEFRLRWVGESGDEEEVVIQKHDVKALCDPAHLPAVQEAASVDKAVREESLGASAKRNTRVRPDDEELSQMLESKRPYPVVLRDGERWAGAVASFGRWDVTLRLYGGAELVVLFHALHPKTVE